jgi:hypothetical protein
MAKKQRQEEVKSHVLHSSHRRLLLGAGMGIREDVVLHLPYGAPEFVSSTKSVNHPIPFIDSVFDGRE